MPRIGVAGHEGASRVVVRTTSRAVDTGLHRERGAPGSQPPRRWCRCGFAFPGGTVPTGPVRGSKETVVGASAGMMSFDDEFSDSKFFMIVRLSAACRRLDEQS
jgi:hypothetical protein